MDELKEAAIKDHYANIVKCINSLWVMDHLVTLLSLDEMDFIRKSQFTPQERTRELIAILFKKSEELRPFERFIKALEKTDTSHEIMAKAILNTYTHVDNPTEFETVPRTSLFDAGKTKYGLQTAKQSLKEMYLTRFQEVRPFSLPFTFHIENTWVSLALKEEKKDSEATEDHAELLERAFSTANMLIIEGDPATGKTSLMRRLAYEWAKGPQELLHYDLLLYAEFREVREKTFQSIADLVLCYSKKYLSIEGYENLEIIINNGKFCRERRILVLLDGYDESSLEEQCSELRSYVYEKTINKALLFNTVVTTRKGYLSTHRGVKGRLVFAEVLGFTTMTQKEKYVFKHFYSQEIDNKENTEAVHSLLNNNKNMNKLAETPLFLTFICLVHERIVDGTLLELYCNIIWWLIDRHQQDFPERDIPCWLGFQNGTSDKFETIQDHYLHFPQLHLLGKMALRNLEENAFKPSYCEQFNLQPIIEQVGLLRKERNHDNSFKLVTSFHFPHRTIQEFLAAFYCFCSNEPTSEWLLPNYILNTSNKSEYNPSGMNEFERFLFRIALSDKIPIQAEKRQYYFDNITSMKLDMTTFDVFNTAAGINNDLLNWFISQCRNVQGIEFSGCPFSVNCQLSFTNCPSLKNLKFHQCEMGSYPNLGIAALPAIHIVQFSYCNIDMATWQSITDQISNSKVKYLQLTLGRDFSKGFLIHLQQCNNVEKMDIYIYGYKMCQNDLLSFTDLIKLQSLTFLRCTFSANSQLSFTNCPSLKNLTFRHCKIESSTIVGIATLPAIDTVEFYECTFDLAIWQLITAQIGNSSVRCLQLTADFFVEESYSEFLHHLQKCERIQQITVRDAKDSNSTIQDPKYILKPYEESVTANLALTAQELPALTSITISDERGGRLPKSRRLSERNRERIEKAGQQRNPRFSIKYV